MEKLGEEGNQQRRLRRSLRRSLRRKSTKEVTLGGRTTSSMWCPRRPVKNVQRELTRVSATGRGSSMRIENGFMDLVL